jgi:hypothetical protein
MPLDSLLGFHGEPGGAPPRPVVDPRALMTAIGFQSKRYLTFKDLVFHHLIQSFLVLEYFPVTWCTSEKGARGWSNCEFSAPLSDSTVKNRGSGGTTGIAGQLRTPKYRTIEQQLPSLSVHA